MRKWKKRKAMERTEIIKRINDAKAGLKSDHPDAASVDKTISNATVDQYEVNAWRIFRQAANSKEDTTPIDAVAVIRKIREAKTTSTLRMHARSVRHVSMQLLQAYLKLADEAQRDKDWAAVEEIISMPQLEALIKLSSLLPSDYRNPILPEFSEPWEASKKRKSKKTSLHGLPVTWREELIAHSSGQFYLPTLIVMLTGCRPQEVANGVTIRRRGKDLYARVIGAKVKENTGQKVRAIKLPQHPLKELLSDIMNEDGKTKDQLIITADKPNSVTTHIRSLAKQLWPQHKEDITSYSGRHAMAADCKAVIAKDDTIDSDLASKTLGHCVDKTASYYGTSSQGGGGISMAPQDVTVTTPIRHKSKARNETRKSNGEIPSQKQGNDKGAKKRPEVRRKK